MRFLAGMVVVAGLGCGGDGSSQTIDASEAASLDDRARACAIVGACVGYSASQCIAALDLNGTAAQVACVLEKTAADCVGVRACVGQRITPDPACTPGCADDDTVVR